jgi:hypothetical protein
MDYNAVHNKIVERAKVRERDKNQYYEIHHILPRCLGGSNKADNLVSLTAKEHFLCHALLIKITTGEARIKMLHALSGMRRKNTLQQRITSRLYECFRKEHAEVKRKEMFECNPMNNKEHRLAHKKAMETRNNIGMSGRKHSEETRAKMKKARSKQVITAETKRKLSEHRKKESQDPNYINGCRVGWYITPWGNFKSLSDAADSKPCNRISIKNWCRINNKKKITNLTVSRSNLFTQNDIGKTFAEYGFGFKEL